MTAPIKNLYGLILAGGYSRRMGQDKALIEFHGKPQYLYAHEILAPYCEKVFLSKRMGASISLENNIEDLSQYANKGPLSGILSAMETYPHADWLVLACDLPLVEGETIEALIHHRDHLAIATVFRSANDRLPEPLCGIWEHHGKPLILKQVLNGVECPRKILIKYQVNVLDLKKPHWLDNANTPEELQRVLAAIKGVKEKK